MAEDRLRIQLTTMEKRMKFAWAKYYSTIRDDLELAHNQYNRINTVTSDSLPQHIKDEFKAMADELRRKWDCPICMNMIETTGLEITNCGHFYCRGCLNTLKEASRTEPKWSCAVCRKKHPHH